MVVAATARPLPFEDPLNPPLVESCGHTTSASYRKNSRVTRWTGEGELPLLLLPPQSSPFPLFSSISPPCSSNLSLMRFSSPLSPSSIIMLSFPPPSSLSSVPPFLLPYPSSSLLLCPSPCAFPSLLHLIHPLVETKVFFKALSQVGTDFTMMTLLLPKRTRKELKVRTLSIMVFYLSRGLILYLHIIEQVQEGREEQPTQSDPGPP